MKAMFPFYFMNLMAKGLDPMAKKTKATQKSGKKDEAKKKPASAAKTAARKPAPPARKPAPAKKPAAKQPVKKPAPKPAAAKSVSKPVAPRKKPAAAAPAKTTPANKNTAKVKTPPTAPVKNALSGKPPAGLPDNNKKKNDTHKMQKNTPKAASPASDSAPTKEKPAGKDDKVASIVKRLMTLGRARGYVTYDELNSYLPGDEFSADVIDSTIAALTQADINVVEEPEESEKAEKTA